MAAKKRWKDLGAGRQCAVVLAACVQLGLQAAALRDLRQRTPAQVNGSKGKWVVASFINFAGPITYFLRGRKGKLSG